MPTATKPRGPLEKEIQKQILDYLHLRGIFSWRNNTGGLFWKDTNRKQHYMRFGEIGSGDILGCTKSGRFFSIEVKRPGGKPTPDQQLFMAEVVKNNGIAFVATSIEDVDRGLSL